MPQIEKSKVQVLLNLGLAKATADYSRDGFGKLADAIHDLKKGETPVISKRYIDERIYQQLKKNDKESSISLKIEYLNEIATFANFLDFFDYEAKYASVNKNLEAYLRQGATTGTITIVVDQADHDFCRERIEHLILRNQINSLTYTSVDFEKLQYSELEKHVDLGGSVVLFLFNVELMKANGALLKQIASETQKNAKLIPVWVTETQKDSFSPDWLLFDDIALTIQCLLTCSEIKGEKDSTKARHKASTTNISNSGSVNLGKIGKIKAEYISARDMHININKSEK